MPNPFKEEVIVPVASHQPRKVSRRNALRDSILSFKQEWWTKEKKAPLYYTASSVSLSLAQMVAGVIIVRLIRPQDLGIWQSVNLALTYSVFLLAGVGNGLSRELPYYLGAKNVPAAERLAGTTLLYTHAICLLALLGGAGVVTFLVLGHRDPKFTLAAAAVTLLIAFNFYQNYLFITFRSKSSFVDLSGVQMWQGSLKVATLPFLYFLGYQGLVLRYVTVAGVALYLLHRVRPIKVAAAWDTDGFKLLLKTGIPIFALDYIRSCATTSDRVALLHSGGVKEVGLYSLALSVYAAFEVIPVSITHYVYPRMSYHYGRDKNPRALWSLAWKVTLLMAGVMLPIAVAGWFLLPPLVRILFPKYIEGTHAAQLMLFAAVSCGAATGVNALWSMKAWKWMTIYQVTFSGLLAAGPFVGIKVCSSPLTGAACGMAAARLLSAGFAVAFTYFATHQISRQGMPG